MSRSSFRKIPKPLFCEEISAKSAKKDPWQMPWIFWLIQNEFAENQK